MVWTRTAWVVGCACWAAMAWGQAPAADVRAAFDDSYKRIADLRQHDRPEEAVAVAEEFLRQFPQAMPYSRWAAGQVSVIVSKDLTDLPKKEDVPSAVGTCPVALFLNSTFTPPPASTTSPSG